jgi:hypothetical protein
MRYSSGTAELLKVIAGLRYGYILELYSYY